MTVRSAAEVFDDHLRLRQEADLENDLARNYAEDVVLLTGFGVFRGHDGVRAAAARLRRQVPGSSYAYRVRLVERGNRRTRAPGSAVSAAPDETAPGEVKGVGVGTQTKLPE